MVGIFDGVTGIDLVTKLGLRLIILLLLLLLLLLLEQLVLLFDVVDAENVGEVAALEILLLV